MASATTRPARPDDLYRIAIPTGPRLAPDGSAVAFTVQRVGPAFDKYRTAVWLAATDGDEPARQLTIGAKRDGHARWAPDGRTLAFLSDRRTAVEEEPRAPKEREDANQVHVLRMDGPGEARRLTDFPRGVEGFEWSPDGKSLAVLSSSRELDREADTKARRRLGDAKPGEPPTSDYRFLDRLRYQADSAGFVQTRRPQLWIIEVGTGEAKRLTDLDAGVGEITWSPDGKRIAFSTGAARDPDISTSQRIAVVEVRSGRLTVVADGPTSIWFTPTWLPDGKRLLVLGGKLPHVFYGIEIHAFPADGSDHRGGRRLTTADDVMPSSNMNSDLTIGEGARLIPIDGGRAVLFTAPHRGSTELWRLPLDGGDAERLTEGRQYLSSFDAVPTPDGIRVAAVRSSATELPEVVVGEIRGRDRGSKGSTGRLAGLRTVSELNREFSREVPFTAPIERWVDVDGRQVQAWLLPAADPAEGGRKSAPSARSGPRPTVVEIHGGPHTLYGWSPFLEFQILAGAGMSVLYTNPRGSEGYGRAFNEANLNDWGEGPMRDVIACLDSFVDSGHVDSDRLGVTGGSYGGYLTTWIVGHTDRFKAAFTARSVADMALLFQVGDLTGTEWPRFEIGSMPWDDPERHRQLSPATYADAIRTPLLIQHSERDLRTTVGQAEMLFARLRLLRRPVRLMRVPEESHELTRSGTPFRRAENLAQVRDWFRHFLIEGKRRLPPLPRTKHGI